MKWNMKKIGLVMFAALIMVLAAMIAQATTHDDAVGGFNGVGPYKGTPFCISATKVWTSDDPGVASDVHRLVNIPAKTLVEAVYYESTLQWNSTTGVVSKNDWAFTLGDGASAAYYATVTSASNATSTAGVWCYEDVGKQSATGTAVVVSISKWYSTTNAISVTLTTPPTNATLKVTVKGQYFGP